MKPGQALTLMLFGMLLGAAIAPATADAAVPAEATERLSIAVIGTGDMGDSLGRRFAGLGHRVVYGSREPASDKVQKLVEQTGHGAVAMTPSAAAESAAVIVLAVPWPAMETVAKNLGVLRDKIVVDISMPSVQGNDGYYVPLVATSSAEMIQSWNPGARVVKAFATQGSFVIDNPGVLGGAATVPIAADDREAKELIARLAASMNLDPVDAGPLRMAREIEALQRLYMVPVVQRRKAAWELYFRRSYYWECIWQDDYSAPVADAKNLATIPETQGPAQACPGP